MSSLGATFTSDYLFSLRQIVFDKLYNLPSGILNVGGCRWSYVVCVGGLIFVVCVGGLFLRCRWPYFVCVDGPIFVVGVGGLIFVVCVDGPIFVVGVGGLFC